MKCKNKLKTICEIFCFFAMLILFIDEVLAEHLFQKQNVWYEKIPANPTINPNSENYINDILINSEVLQVSWRDWSFPIWYADSNAPVTTVQMDSSTGPCGSNAIANKWNVVPIPSGAKSAGMDSYCAGQSRDGHMVIISQDKRWAWDFYKARKCTDGIWRASCIRKRALRTGETAVGVGDGSGVLPKEDGRGNPRACGPSAHLHGLITKKDYDNGYIDHVLAFAYNGEKKADPYWSFFPCASYRSGISDRQWAMILGQRLQLDPAFNCDSMPNAKEFTKMICRALQEYGAIFTMNAGKGYNSFYLESIEGKTDFWAGIIQNPLPIPIEKLRVVEPIFIKTDTIPPAPPAIIEVK